MTLANGTYPTSALAVVQTAKGQMLRKEAAAAWDALANEVRRRYGWNPALTDSYRPYAVQERIFLDRYRTTPMQYKPGRVDRRSWRGKTWYRRPGTASASTPGLSNHGLGLAVDVTALGGFNGQRYRQLASVAAAYGWSNATGRKIDEAWHWEFTGQVTAPIVTYSGASVAPRPAVTAPSLDTLKEHDMPVRIRRKTGAIVLVDLTKGSFIALDPVANSVADRLKIPIVWDNLSDLEFNQVRQLVRDTAAGGVRS